MVYECSQLSSVTFGREEVPQNYEKKKVTLNFKKDIIDYFV